MNRATPCFLLLVVGFLSTSASADDDMRRRDVIYGRKHGMALTMDVFTPAENANGIGLVYCVSGGYRSGPQMIRENYLLRFVRRGFTVFAVVHGSSPRYTVPAAINDIHRAVRYVRHHAEEFGIAPDRIGIMGGSSGGHLACAIGMNGRPGEEDTENPVERESSRVQAVACLFPPTDLLNYGEPGVDMRTVLGPAAVALAIQRFDRQARAYVPISEEQQLEIMASLSPVNHVTDDDAPTLIIHGDADENVPLQQSQVLIEKLEEAGVACRLVVREGMGHGYRSMSSEEIAADVGVFCDWFEEHLGE